MKNILSKNFGELMITHRSKKKMSLQVLASSIDVSYGTVYLYETGKQQPTLYNALKIAKVLDFNIEPLKESVDVQSDLRREIDYLKRSIKSLGDGKLKNRLNLLISEYEKKTSGR